MQINNGDYDPLKPLSEIIKYENVWFVFNINFFHGLPMVWNLIK